MTKYFLKEKEIKDLKELGFSVQKFFFKQTAPLLQQAFDFIEKKYGLVHFKKPTYWYKNDRRNGHYEVFIFDLRDVRHRGTKAHNFNDVGFQIHFVYEKDTIIDKLFTTSQAADYGALKEMIRILKERKNEVSD